MAGHSCLAIPKSNSFLQISHLMDVIYCTKSRSLLASSLLYVHGNAKLIGEVDLFFIYFRAYLFTEQPSSHPMFRKFILKL